MALFETAGYLMIELIDLLDKKSEIIKNRFADLLSDKEFIHSTEYTVDSNISVYKRFEIVEEKIEEVRNA
ncbi:MAG: hypothetical protein BECKG1743F_GA0114225_105243 [Candidatus Kentron sp. G]|nr:MAG: hypothetical protein BECKG1743F_GA0114225_105243 [Candidatus Kentron sp. G]